MKRFSLLLLIFLSVNSQTFAQDSSQENFEKIYDLEQKIRQVSKSEKAKYYLQLSKLYWRSNTSKSIIYGQKALSLYRDKEPVKQAAAYQNLAVAYYYAGKADSTIYYAGKILQMADSEQLLHQKGNANNLIGVAYQKLGDYDKSLIYKNKALTIRIQLKDSVNIAGSLDNIASVYKHRGEYDKAIALSQKAADIYKAQNDLLNLSGVYYNIADLYVKLKQYNDAVYYYKQALDAVGNKDFLFLTDIQNSMGTVFLYEKKLDSALLYFEKALKGYQKTGIQEGVAIAYENLGETFIEKKLYSKGFKYLYDALQMYKRLGYKTDILSVNETLAKSFAIINQKDSTLYYYHQTYNLARGMSMPKFITKSLDGLYRFYLKNKDTVKAYKYYNRLVQYKDSLKLADTQLRVKELEEKYQNEKKQQEIERLQHKRKLDKANFKILLISSVSLLLFILAGAYMIVQKRRKQKEIAELELEKSRLKRQSLTREIELKNRQLTTHALNMLQKNKLLLSFSNSIAEVLKQVEGETKKNLLHLKREINHLLHSERDWETFKVYFEQVNKDFIKNLKKVNSSLTSNDIRLATLIKLNMSNKEIASILNITHQSVKNARYRLKNKLFLKPEQDLKEFIETI